MLMMEIRRELKKDIGAFFRFSAIISLKLMFDTLKKKVYYPLISVQK